MNKKNFVIQKIIQWPFLYIHIYYYYYCAFCILFCIVICRILIEIRSIFSICNVLMFVYLCDCVSNATHNRYFVRFQYQWTLHSNSINTNLDDRFFPFVFYINRKYTFGMVCMLLLLFVSFKNSLSIHAILFEWSEKWFNTKNEEKKHYRHCIAT